MPDDCQAYIANHEGCELNVYNDTMGNPTVCIGHLCSGGCD